ncbi:hypothetical protein [Neoroseomonas lacus]|nr:hypothetical protein [Neoroseomonas lacus]
MDTPRHDAADPVQIGRDAARLRDTLKALLEVSRQLAVAGRQDDADAFAVAERECLRALDRADAEDREQALATLPDPSTNPAWGHPAIVGGPWDRWRHRALRDNGRPPSPDEVRFVIGLGEPWLSHMLAVWGQPRRPRAGWQQRLEAAWRDYMGARR